MAKERNEATPPEAVISIVGPGMRIVGECEAAGTVRVEGTIEGSVRAGKAVVVGKEGVVRGDIVTHDAVVAGRVVGTLVAHSRLELQATSRIEGEVTARRLHLEEGAVLNGTVQMGEAVSPAGAPATRGSEPAAGPAAGPDGRPPESALDPGAHDPEGVAGTP